MGRTRFGAIERYLHEAAADELVLSFSDIEAIIGFPLSSNAHLKGWWDHNNKIALRHAICWRNAGFVARLLPGATTVLFTRVEPRTPIAPVLGLLPTLLGRAVTSRRRPISRRSSFSMHA